MLRWCRLEKPSAAHYKKFVADDPPKVGPVQFERRRNCLQGMSGVAEPNRGVAELIVQGPAGQVLRQRLVEGQVVRLGRAPTSGWAIEWDRSISREHADLCWQDGKLSVACLLTAANPIKLRGELLREVLVGGSEAFEIGQSSFYVDVSYLAKSNVVSQTMQVTPEPIIRMPLPTAHDEPQRKSNRQTRNSTRRMRKTSLKNIPTTTTISRRFRLATPSGKWRCCRICRN